MLRLYYTYSTVYVGLGRKNTEVKQYGPRLAFGWVTIQGLDVDAVATNTVKPQKPRNGASIVYASAWAKKNWIPSE